MSLVIDQEITPELEQCQTGTQWKRVGIKHHHGLNLPLFCLHSSTSSGVGEYPDLLPLLPWCKKVGFDVIQLLPLNDTGRDPSPYNAISAFALNPLHLGLRFLPGVERDPELREELERLKELKRDNRIDYDALMPAREQWLQKYLDRFGEELSQKHDFELFCKEHPWLESYALFKALKVAYGWVSWDEWPIRERWPTDQDFRDLLQEHSKAVLHNFLIQYLCFKQMENVQEEAKALGVKLKGDIPILIGIESADVWRNPDLFHTGYRAGAPPDVYNADGQYWGFPIYNWQRLESTGYFWWKERLRVAQKLYQIYRIDHIIGFFRIWAIPPNQPAIQGAFLPRNPEKWISDGKRILAALTSETNMLPIGEDLGTVSAEIRQALKELGICGTKVMRWERNWEHKGEFISIFDYSPLSMTTVSTHDSDTLTLWWRDAPEEAQTYCAIQNWTYHPQITREQLQHFLYESHRSTSLFHINLINEYLALAPKLSWPNPEEDRINFPGIVSANNWSYRIRPSVEELIASDELEQAIKELIP